VKVWDVATGSVTLTLSQFDQVAALAWSADGMALASAGEDSRILVHDATQGYLAARASAALPLVNRRLISGEINPADLRLRAEIRGSCGEWEQAGADARKFLELEDDQRWLVLNGWVAGPYPADLEAGFRPEQAIDPNEHAPLGSATKIAPDWRQLPRGNHGFVDLGSMTDYNEQISAFVMFKVYSPEKQSVTILLDSVDRAQLWLNGEQIQESPSPKVVATDETVFLAVLHPGWNTLLAQVVNLPEERSFYLRVSDVPGEVE
jgi:hypothetical protein